jgi:hypothetical protein
VLDRAKVEGHRSGENPARWRGQLDQLLPKRQRLTRGHPAAMPYADVAAFMTDLRAREAVAARCLELTILTVARSGEALGARWEEFDLDRKIWTVPPERMKGGREHRVPLSGRALDILRALYELRNGEYVFPGQKVNKPLSGMAMEMMLRRMKIENATVHGFVALLEIGPATKPTFLAKSPKPRSPMPSAIRQRPPIGAAMRWRSAGSCCRHGADFAAVDNRTSFRSIAAPSLSIPGRPSTGSHRRWRVILATPCTSSNQIEERPMSEADDRTSIAYGRMPALSLNADIKRAGRRVRFGPGAAIRLVCGTIDWAYLRCGSGCCF